MSALRHMDLQGNQLSRLEDLNLLRKHVCCLTHLNLSANPMSRTPSCQPLTLRRLPHLASLDGRTLTQTDWELAAASHGLLTVPMLEQHGSTRLLSIWSTPGMSAHPPRSVQPKDCCNALLQSASSRKGAKRRRAFGLRFQSWPKTAGWSFKCNQGAH